MKINVLVKPRAHASSLVQEDDGTWTARVTSPPVDGKANKELMRMIATRFGCPVSAVEIQSGTRGRHKIIVISAHDT